MRKNGASAIIETKNRIKRILENADPSAPPAQAKTKAQLDAEWQVPISIEMTPQQMAALPDDHIGFTGPGDSDAEMDDVLDWIDAKFPERDLDAFELPAPKPPGRDSSFDEVLDFVAMRAPDRAETAMLWKKRYHTGFIVSEYTKAVEDIDRLEYQIERDSILRQQANSDTDFSTDAVTRRLNTTPTEAGMSAAKEKLAQLNTRLQEIGAKLEPLLMTSTLETLRIHNSIKDVFEPNLAALRNGSPKAAR